MDGHQLDEHALELLADELLDQAVGGVARDDVVLDKDHIDEVGAGFKGKVFGEDERVVAVEEEGGDLWRCQLRGR
jgi:hypothetical protein